jgi:SNF2 family DNA or RNA helicase
LRNKNKKMNEIELTLHEVNQTKTKLVELQDKLDRLRVEQQANQTVSVVLIVSPDNLITAKLTTGRTDIVELLRGLPSRRYDHIAKVNTFLIADYLKFEAGVKSLQNVQVVLDDVSKQRLSHYLTKTRLWISLDPQRGFKVVLHQLTSKTEFEAAIESAYIVAGKSRTYLASRAEGWRILEYATRNNYEVEWTDDAKAIAVDQQNRREELFALATAEDCDFDVELNGESLRKFQKVGSKFATLAKLCINGDVMGLGKSPQGIATAKYNNWRTFFIVPSRLILNWEHEIEKFTGIKPYVCTGTSPEPYHVIDILVDKHQYNLISYESLSRPITSDESWTDDDGIYHENIKLRWLWIELINSSTPDFIVPDEAHYIKNLDSARSKAVSQLEAPNWMFLTGTPVLNRPGELFPMLRIIDPISFNSYERFMRSYSDGRNGAKNVEQLRDLLKPIFIRRLKKDVVKELPPINRITQYHTLSEDAKEEYNKRLAGVMTSVSGQNINITDVLAQISYLKEVCIYDKHESTVALAEDIIENNIDDPYNKVLIFTERVQSAKDLGRRLGVSALVITGEDAMQYRMDTVKMFQEEKHIKYLVCSTKAASEGLNITAAGNVIFNDLMWTPSAHEQAEGRAYGRLSDLHSIDSYYIVAENTIENWIMKLLNEKLSMINQVVDGQGDGSTGEGIAGALINMLKDGTIRLGNV